MKIHKLYFILPCCLIILSISYWLFESYQLAPIEKNKSTTPDYWMTQVVVTKFDEQGHIDSQLSTPKLVHYREQDTSHLTQPTLLFYDGKAVPWQINAQYGQSKKKSEIVLLRNHVFIHQKANGTQKETTLLTESLNVYPKIKQAHTEAPVTILQPGMKIRAIGMHVDLTNNKVDFLSQAKGYYENS